MFKNRNKVIPLYFNNNNLKCCICYENKKKYIKCSNEKCNDGVICLVCVNKMSDKQKEKCPICRVKLDSFIMNHKKKEKNINIARTTNYLIKNLLYILKLIAISLIIMTASYLIGFCVIITIKNDSNYNELLTNIHPMIFMGIGALMMLTIGYCIGSIINYQVNYRHLVRN